jgi:chromosome segregation ATPase
MRSRWIPLVVLLLVAFAAALLWANKQYGTGHSTAATDQLRSEFARHQEAADETKKAIADLQQQLKLLQSVQQQATDQIGDLKRQLSREQGDRKLLSEQVGALTVRVDSLTSSNAETPGQPAKKRRSPR